MEQIKEKARQPLVLIGYGSILKKGGGGGESQLQPCPAFETMDKILFERTRLFFLMSVQKGCVYIWLSRPVS